MEVEQFDELNEVKVDVDVKLALWRALRDWTYLTDKWMVDLFDDIKSEVIYIFYEVNNIMFYFSFIFVCFWSQEISKETQKYQKVVARAGRKLTAEHEVVALLKQRVDKFFKIVPIVTDLKNPTLESRHWEEITALINYVIHDNMVWNVNWVCGEL